MQISSSVSELAVAADLGSNFMTHKVLFHGSVLSVCFVKDTGGGNASGCFQEDTV